MSLWKVTVTNNTSTAGDWATPDAAQSIPANSEIVRFSGQDGRTVGTTNSDRLVMAGTGFSDLTNGTIVVNKADITENFYVKVEALVGNRQIVVFEHTGT